MPRTRNGDAQASPAARIKPTTAPACALPRSRARPSPRGRARRISGHVVPGLTARVATTLVVLSLRSRSRVACVGPRGPSPSPTAGVARGAVRAPRAARRAAGVGVAVCGRPRRRQRVCGARAVFILFMRPEDCDHPMPVAKSDAACCARDGNATSSCIEAKPSEQSALQVYGGAAAPSGYHNQSEEWHAPASTRRGVA